MKAADRPGLAGADRIQRGRRAAGQRAPFAQTAPLPVDFPIVALGASAGGLDAFRKLFDALPADLGMAFVLIQHLDPSHASMMVELLAGHTKNKVQQAADGMPLEIGNVYIIPPGAYLSIKDGALRLSEPRERHGARLPIDFFLRSLAAEYGERAICVILSGTGADGSIGLKAIKERGGLVIVQSPDDAAFDGMPKSAMMTSLADFVLPVAEMPQTLLSHAAMRHRGPHQGIARGGDTPDWLVDIIALLRTRTAYDFTFYKPGTLQRRIERRMAIAASADGGKYFDILKQNAVELDLLAKDLLINVTGFFRDPKAFELLAQKIVPDLVARQAPDQPLRIWVAGCSTGEETYSIAMLFLEEFARTKRTAALQVFASDIDGDAVALAREGRYPVSIVADVSPARLARFFSKDEHGYRIVPELRALVVFTTQNLLADPPFSHLDLVSCRNLLIYLRPEAQEKVLLLFDFALRESGVLFSRRFGGGGRSWRPVRANLKSASALSTYRQCPDSGGRFPPRGRGTPAGSDRGSPYSPARRPSARADATDAAPHVCAGCGSDQSAWRMPVFLGADRPLFAGGRRRTQSRSLCHGAPRSPQQAQGGNRAGRTGEKAHHRHRCAGQPRRKLRRGHDRGGALAR